MLPTASSALQAKAPASRKVAASHGTGDGKRGSERAHPGHGERRDDHQTDPEAGGHRHVDVT